MEDFHIQTDDSRSRRRTGRKSEPGSPPPRRAEQSGLSNLPMPLIIGGGILIAVSLVGGMIACLSYLSNASQKKEIARKWLPLGHRHFCAPAGNRKHSNMWEKHKKSRATQVVLYLEFYAIFDSKKHWVYAEKHKRNTHAFVWLLFAKCTASFDKLRSDSRSLGLRPRLLLVSVVVVGT